MLRILLVAPFSALITVIIFLGMYYMIRVDQPTIGTPKEMPTIIITAQKPKPPVPPDYTDDVIPPEPPEPTEIEFPDRTSVGDGVPNPRPSPGDIIKTAFLVTDMTGQAIVTIPPVYPERCKGRGAQGVVIVEFDVNEIGDVINPRIISSADSCFDSTVLRTIARWKFAPATRNGNPIIQRNLRRAFRFELEE